TGEGGSGVSTMVAGAADEAAVADGEGKDAPEREGPCEGAAVEGAAAVAVEEGGMVAGACAAAVRAPIRRSGQKTTEAAKVAHVTRCAGSAEGGEMAVRIVRIAGYDARTR
ncbi:MAG TPA: hypothetical protein VK841_03825, partial [Polyangiaceae bacterium]|nr:hypothetical protein [Polyangiaceae bacterium]